MKCWKAALLIPKSGTGIRDKQTEAVAEYSEPLARRLIEKVTVYDEKLVVEFKSGLQIDVEA